ncbi:hypothetical protein [Brumicola pallidula]|uniref:Uncharacterized protein n=1 Tax=Brumicola pallidula DSM 14239 = ACAM 615 TaxID=1121922 RepID=K6ZEW0_9ALTE|nr:hypothetical protein [Glaciecola pallidula]GAC27463.1 hypothetical protein GPAL_0583 [Glaciecola pallidula DSM 14239 = ACAM 615]
MHKYPQNRQNLLSPKRSLDIIETRIRGGIEHNNPPLVNIYLLQIADLAAAKTASSARFVIASRAFQLLYDTIADESVEVHWRVLCLDKINLPLQLMKKSCHGTRLQQQYRHLQYKLTLLYIKSYFLLNNPD